MGTYPRRAKTERSAPRGGSVGSVSRGLLTEQTVQEVVQAGTTAPWNWFQVVAAVGTILSAITLTLAIVFRIRDSQTRTRIWVEVDPGYGGVYPALIFQVVNTSKTPIQLNSKAHLVDDDMERAVVSIDREEETGLTQQGSHKTYAIEMRLLRMLLIEGHYRNRDTVPLVFAVYDGARKLHELPIDVLDLQDPDAITIKASSFPWHKRWYRLIRRRLG